MYSRSKVGDDGFFVSSTLFLPHLFAIIYMKGRFLLGLKSTGFRKTKSRSYHLSFWSAHIILVLSVMYHDIVIDIVILYLIVISNTLSSNVFQIGWLGLASRKCLLAS